MTDQASTCTCDHPRGEHREGTYECLVESCPCTAFLAQMEVMGHDTLRAPRRQKRVVRKPPTRKTR